MHGHEGVTVTGSAAVDVEPDIVVAEVGVDVREPDVTTALRTAEERLALMRDTFLEHGVVRADIRTAQTSIWRDDRTDDAGTVTVATVVRLGLRVTLRDVGAAGDLVHAALAAAGTVAQMNSLSFATSDAAAALARARDAAFDDARAIATAYAAKAGRELGPVVAVVEQPAGGPPTPRMLRASADARASLPVEPGQQSVAATVTVTWTFAD